MMEEMQASIMQDMIEMMDELMRKNRQSSPAALRAVFLQGRTALKTALL